MTNPIFSRRRNVSQDPEVMTAVGIDYEKLSARTVGCGSMTKIYKKR